MQRAQIGPKKKVGFVCSGGGTKAAAFHLGVALALQERGFRFFGGVRGVNPGTQRPGSRDISIYVGSSAGSIIGAYLASGYSVERVLESFQAESAMPKLTYPKMFRITATTAREQLMRFQFFKMTAELVKNRNWESIINLSWLKASGLFSTAGIEEYMRAEVLPTNSFNDLVADLFIVASQLNHSKKAVFGRFANLKKTPENYLPLSDIRISHACAASVALPLIFSPYVLEAKTGDRSGEKMTFIDGEIRDTLSTHVATDAGADLVFASYTHQPYHFRKEIGSLAQLGLPAILTQAAYLLVEEKIQHHIRTERSHRGALDAVLRFCKHNGISGEKQRKLLELLEDHLNHSLKVDTIYIHPRPKDDQMFLLRHFSLSPAKLAEAVQVGYHSARDSLAAYEFS